MRLANIMGQAGHLNRLPDGWIRKAKSIGDLQALGSDLGYVRGDCFVLPSTIAEPRA
jgi:hypothetical protein